MGVGGCSVHAVSALQRLTVLMLLALCGVGDVQIQLYQKKWYISLECPLPPSLKCNYKFGYANVIASIIFMRNA